MSVLLKSMLVMPRTGTLAHYVVCFAALLSSLPLHNVLSIGFYCFGLCREDCV
jgi:hypothetical protein